jgi:hypothetical protein
LALRRIQLRVAVFRGDAHLRRDQHWIAGVAPITFLHPANDLTLHAYHRGGCVLLASTNVRDFPELPGLDPTLELLPDLGIGGFSHAAHQRYFKDRAAVQHSRSLEDMISRPGHGSLCLNLWLRHLVLLMLARLRDDAVRLMPVLGSQLAVPL